MYVYRHPPLDGWKWLCPVHAWPPSLLVLCTTLLIRLAPRRPSAVHISLNINGYYYLQEWEKHQCQSTNESAFIYLFPFHSIQLTRSSWMIIATQRNEADHFVSDTTYPDSNLPSSQPECIVWWRVYHNIESLSISLCLYRNIDC